MAYTADFEFHRSQFRAHILGTTSNPLPASFILPTGYWSSSEKDAFFHALQVHSRLRPDLIAADIKTKSVVDVCAYIDLLVHASAQSAPPPSFRESLKCAMDMSDAWIEYEEVQAKGLLEAEYQQEHKAVEDRRAERDDVSDEWLKEDRLSRLGFYHLKALDRLSLPSPTVDESMSPKSRRRVAKRLYMRKRRAETTGAEADLDPEKLLAGRRSVKQVTKKPRPTKYKKRSAKKWIHAVEDGETYATIAPSSTESDLPSSDDEPDPRFRGKSGLGTATRARIDLQNRGIDASTVADAELDVFVISTLAKLMRDFHAQATPEDKFQTNISLDTLSLLKDILHDFITPVIHSAISLREKEILLKNGIKVWRMEKEDEVTASNVVDALDMQASASAILTADVVVENEEEDKNNEDSEQSESEAGERRFVEDDTDFPLRLPLARELAPPFLRLDPTNEALIAADTNVDDLLVELAEEHMLDEKDQQQERAYEEVLWKAIREHVDVEKQTPV
uniref:Uncharacterized protein n=1 Tax=Mycena chlorophos TaxID=658473 RepID=A0ABQ0M2F7_MYCCL|nr:predicted protein [Mycena chlorophos]